MADDDKSNLKPFSLGIVVETKPPGTDYILVSPIETLNVQPEGNIKDQKKDFSGDQQDLESTSFQSEHESKNYIRAKWMPHSESNRVTAPDVVASETVMLYKYANVDEYYWHDVLREPELRRLEDVMYAYSNLPSGATSFDETTSYWVRYNTRDKYVHLHTSKNDGEPFMYDVIINAKEGKVTIQDDAGNSLVLDSQAGDLTGTLTNDINLKAGNNINLEAGNAINMKSSVIDEKCDTKSESYQSSVSQCSGSKVTQASSIVNDAPIVRNTGNVETAGSDMANPNLNAVH